MRPLADVPELPNLHPWVKPSLGLMRKISAMGWQAAIEHELGHLSWEHLCWARTIAAWALGQEAPGPDVCCDNPDTTYRCATCQDRGVTLYEKHSKISGEATYARPCVDCRLGDEFSSAWDYRGEGGAYDVLSQPRPDGGYQKLDRKKPRRADDDDTPPF